MYLFHAALTRYRCLLLAVCMLMPACGVESPDPTQPEGDNIANTVLPGDWMVQGEQVVFSFDADGVPVAIRNEADPNDWRTNVRFGDSGHLEAPIGSVDTVWQPGIPFINADTGEAAFSAEVFGNNIQAFDLRLPGSGRATFAFTGQYDAASGELHGSSHYEIYYGTLLVYSDTVDQYILKKMEEPQ